MIRKTIATIATTAALTMAGAGAASALDVSYPSDRTPRTADRSTTSSLSMTFRYQRAPRVATRVTVDEFRAAIGYKAKSKATYKRTARVAVR